MLYFHGKYLHQDKQHIQYPSINLKISNHQEDLFSIIKNSGEVNKEVKYIIECGGNVYSLFLISQK